LRLHQIIPGIVPVTSNTIYRWMKAGDFPKPVKISSRSNGWRAEDIRHWIETRKVAA
jgi:prophage regulatory protein